MSDFEKKQREKRDRLYARADNARKEASDRFNSAGKTASMIPMGQPILVEAKRDFVKAGNKVARRLGGETSDPYVLTNLGANIRSTKKRIKELESKKAQPVAEPLTLPGLTVTEDVEANRIRFFFDDKPDAGVRKVMKSYGFRWAPSVGAWQRQITPNARYSAKMAVNTLKGLQP